MALIADEFGESDRLAATTTSRAAQAIDDYIQLHKDDCLVKGHDQRYSINGQRRELEVYRVPLTLLTYSIRNGRFAAELAERETVEGRRLDPEKQADVAIIEQLLLKDEARKRWLKEDIRRVGQMQPGAITWDGAVVNGNRRTAILNELYRETGNTSFSFLEAVRLPRNVSAKDLWRIEAGFQLAIDLLAPYGPINELLKIREGDEYGLSHREIALTLGGNNTDETVRLKLELLNLIEDYLRYIGRPKGYSEAERKVEHFINLQKILKSKAGEALTVEEQTNVLHGTYELIRGGVAHLRIRSVAKVVKDRETIPEFVEKSFTAAGKRPPEQPSTAEEISVQSVESQIQVLQEAMVSESADSAPENVEEGDEDSEEPVDLGRSAGTVAQRKQDLVAALDSVVEKAETRARRNKPIQIISRIESALETLREIPPQELLRLRDDIERLRKAINELANKIEGEP